MQFNKKSAEMSDMEKQVVEVSKKLAASNDLKIKLGELHFNRVRILDLEDCAKKAAVIYVPCSEINQYKKEEHLAEGFEKHISGFQFHIVADRKIEHRTPNTYHPFCRTSVDVHAKLLEDIVAPGFITGKRILYSNGTKTHEFYVSKTKKTDVESRANICSKVYEQLTGMKNVIGFM